MSGNEAVNVYLALGSNMGDREGNLKEALRLLSEKLTAVKVSTIYETEPEGGAIQPPYLNQAAHFTTILAPKTLLTLLKGFELKMGRNSPTGAPRIIDIDILFYGDRIVNNPELTIPHPRITNRAFVLVPLLEIGHDLVHPVENKTVRELFWELPNKTGVKVYK